MTASYWKPVALTVNQCGHPVKPAHLYLGGSELYNTDKSNSPSIQNEDLFQQTGECCLLRYENECHCRGWSQSIFSYWTENEKRSLPAGLTQLLYNTPTNNSAVSKNATVLIVICIVTGLKIQHFKIISIVKY